ncbi:unnamed protein product [Acanthoscelides obtectus]|uniref:Uncharacterized protein n=1 Tax=Acanthoscelides obtectus TaxID=200917 RepID=A0A9P0LPW3_ACAOB|nr:unnamed protein product [Acanthoscelides obtectus]CAK1681233.1 hypothetical protein AOBTE_LOCUS33072 [Acanthoscelides obtectus]
MYLHPDLNLRKMHYLDELEKVGRVEKPSFHTYRRVFKAKNLSFHSPKKDQCSLCVSYREGNDTVKHKLKARYDLHIAEKTVATAKTRIVASMLLHSISKFPTIEEISLRFFETNHGQSEGDSAHSAISRAISKAGNVFLPSQLYPIISLARRNSPYKVVPMKFSDFKDYKSLSKDLRILSIRISESGKNVKWTDVMEVLVTQASSLKIFFKNSHLEPEYDCIVLKRLNIDLSKLELPELNKEQPKISCKKYKDLVSWCQGETPVIRLPEHQQFFLTLPHSDELA